jgi:hypothetical protein
MLMSLEHVERRSVRIVRGLEHQRRDCADEDDLADTCGAMASDVAHDFATAGGVSDEDHVAQVDCFDHRGQVVGVVIHVVAVPRLTRAAVTPPIVGDPPQTT